MSLNYIDDFKREIYIPNGRDYSKAYTEHPQNSQPFGGTTYVRIVFADEKEIIYTNDLPYDENNILDYEYSYKFEAINFHKRRAYYYFTPEMYEQATSIQP